MGTKGLVPEADRFKFQHLVRNNRLTDFQFGLLGAGMWNEVYAKKQIKNIPHFIYLSEQVSGKFLQRNRYRDLDICL